MTDASARTAHDPVRIGIVGTSWWTDSMYLPALANHPQADVRALCGRTEATARELASAWGVPLVFTDWRELLSSGEIDAVVVASANDTHYPITMAALDRGLDVLCEKPVARSASAGDEMAARAAEVGAVTMTPFTYRYMPMFAETKRRLDDGFIGDPYHLNLRYFTQYARDTDYSWRFDAELAGSGVLGDLGSHWLHLAEWLMGPITELGAITRAFVERAPRPDGTPYDRAEDSAIMTASFASGAIGTLQVCAVSWAGTSFGQTHHLDLHGSAGTVYAFSDWDSRQEVTALPAGVDWAHAETGISDASWLGAPRDSVHDTYRHIFRHTDAMTRGWVRAMIDRTPIQPDLTAGARVQRLLEIALESAASDGRQLPVPSTPFS